MNKKIIQKGIKFIELNASFPEQNKEIYEYSLMVILSTFETLALVWILGFCFGYLVGSICFTFFFSISRLYVGGYHAETSGRCKLIYSLLFGISIFLYRGRMEEDFLVALLVIGLIVVIVCSPMESKQQYIIDKKKQKKKAILVSFLLAISTQVLKYFNVQYFYFSSVALIETQLLLLYRYIQEKKNEN